MSDMNVAVILSLVDELTGPANRARGALSGIGETASRIARVGFAAAAAGAVATAGALTNSARQAIDFEAAMADVAKVVDFDVSGVGEGIVALSRQTGVAAEDLAALAAAAGQAGMDTEEAVLAFTDMASTVGVAFDLPAGFVGDALASIQTALGTTVAETGLLADAINHLSNNTAASGDKLLDFTARAAASGRQYGFTEEQTLALGAAMIATGASADVAATSFRAVGRALTRGQSATQAQKDALEQLGLSAEDVARSMQDDALGTLEDVLTRINEMPAEMQASAMTEIFGDEARAVAALAQDLGILQDAYELVADEASYAGSANEEFLARADTAQQRLRVISANFTALSREAGNALLPSLNEGLSRLVTNLQSQDLQDNWFFRLADGVGDFAEGAMGMATAADEMTRFHEAGATAAGVLDGLGERLGAFGSGFMSGASENLDGLETALDGLGEALGRLFGLDEGGNLMETLFGTEEGWGSVGEELGGALVTGLTGIVDLITDIVTLIDEARQGFEDFGEWVDGWVQRIQNIEIDWSGFVPDFELPDPMAAGASVRAWLGDVFDGSDAAIEVGESLPDMATLLDVDNLEQARRFAEGVASSMTAAAAVDVAPALADLGALGDQADALVPILELALSDARSVLASEDWAAEGERLMGTLAAGVRSGSGALASAIRSAVQTGVQNGLSADYNARRAGALQDGTEL